MCLGPGTEIQGTGSLFWRKIGPPICSPICWDFFADLGAGLALLRFGFVHNSNRETNHKMDICQAVV